MIGAAQQARTRRDLKFTKGVGVIITSTRCFQNNAAFAHESAVWNQGVTADAFWLTLKRLGSYFAIFRSRRMGNKSICTVILIGIMAGFGLGKENEALAAEPTAALPPIDAAALGTFLTTRYTDANNYDYWHCKNESQDAESFTLMPAKGVLADGLQQGFELLALGKRRGLSTLWEATTANSFKIEYLGFGKSIDFTDITFSDDNSMKVYSSIEGQFSCNRKSFGKSSPISTPSTTIDSNQPVTTLPAPDEIEDLHAMFGYIVQNKGYAVLAFNDGTYSSDMAVILNKGVKESRANNPKRWGTWRGTAESLELKSWNDTKYDELNWSFLVQPGSPDQKLDRCYSKLSGSLAQNDYDSGIVISSVYCFHENGRFTNNTALWGQSPLGDLYSVDPETVGRYRISGHVADLVYDSGRSIKFAFGFTDKDRNLGSIFLNTKTYLD